MSESIAADSFTVLMLAEDFYPRKAGGAFKDWEVAKYLEKSGDSITVITPKGVSPVEFERVEGVEIRRPYRGLPEDLEPNSLHGQIRRVLFVIYVLPYLLKLIFMRDFDVIYSTNHLFHPIASILSVISNTPHVSFVGYSPSIHDDISFRNPLVLLERMNFRFFMGDRVICETPSIQNILSKKSDSTVIRSDGSVDEKAIFSSIHNYESGQKSASNSIPGIELIFVGRLTRLKNPTKLLDILRELPSEYSLTIVGDGPLRNRIEKDIEEMNLGSKVHLTGQLPHEQALQEIYDSDILVLPSKADAYPAVVFEALSLNTPVLATPVGVLPRINRPNLSIAEIDDFPEEIIGIDVSTPDRIDKETLEQFSINRFTNEVRDNLKKAIT